MTETELRFGVARKPEAGHLKLAVDQFLLRVEILPWDSDAAKHYAGLRTALENSGGPMGNLDMMIAAHALAAGAIRVSESSLRLPTTDFSRA